MDKFLFRSNARRKMVFGIHEPATKAFSKNGGESWLRFVSSAAAKSCIQDNIEVLRLMGTERYQTHLAKMRQEAIDYYKAVRLL